MIVLKLVFVGVETATVASPHSPSLVRCLIVVVFYSLFSSLLLIRIAYYIDIDVILAGRVILFY
ncbi:hypothetical protein [Coxiella-like endosymbiont]|uniref:hypothetical protein n=1 Tax=Coxiella-like endosymbiont TaxID=1592897 RepID=UPI0028692079|nr:hypothetical protein [Coxiella-like endosymbiont]